MRLFYPRHIKSLAYYDEFSPLPFVLRQKGSLYFPCSVSVTVLFANLAATSLDRHQSIRRSSEKSYKIYFDPYNLCSYHFLCPCSKCYECPISYQFNSSVL